MNPRRLLALGLLLPAPALAQWTKLYPAEESELLDVHMVNALDGWAVGSGGAVLHTVNGGIHWESHQVETAALRGIDFWGYQVGLAVGEGLFASSDYGQTWNLVSHQQGLRDVALTTSISAHAVADGGRHLRSDDGGQTWVTSTVAGEDLLCLTFVDPLLGWAAGRAGTLLETTDGGQTWTPIAVPSTADLTDAVLLDPMIGFLAAGTEVLRTEDGGATWSSSPVPDGGNVEGLSILTPDRGWATGPEGKIYRTTNGTGWNVRLDTGGYGLHAVSMGDLESGLAVGVDGRVYRTTNKGKDWTLVHGGGATDVPFLTSLFTNDGQTLLAGTSDSLVLRSEDAGLTWDEVPAGLPQLRLDAIDFLDDDEGYAVGERQGFYPTTGWTNDGGLSWNFTYHLGMYDITDVDAIAPQTAVVCTSSYIWRTGDGGQSWSFVNTTPQSGATAADFVDAQNGWAVGWDFFRTTDGGQSWTFLHDPPDLYHDVAFVDLQTGWAVGAAGKVLRTLDGGSTWQDVSPPNAPILTEVEASDSGDLWIAGDGYVARSGDLGDSWTVETPDGASSAWVRGLAFPSSGDGFLLSGWQPTALWRRTAGCEVTSYCTGKVNSIGATPTLSASGTPSLSQADFSVEVQGGVPGTLALLIEGKVGEAATPFQGGLLCVAPPFLRLDPHALDGAGGGTWTIDHLAEIDPGSSRWYQVWNRDLAHPDGTGVGLSDGLRVKYCQ